MWVLGYRKKNGKFYIPGIHCIAMQKEQALETMRKRACLLNPNQISELIMDNHTDESLCDAVSKEYEEYREEVLLAPHLQWQSQYTACFSAQGQISQIQPIPLKMIFRMGHIHRHNSHQNRSGHFPLAFSRVQFTLLQRAQGERMTVGHHTSMTALHHFGFSCCISQTVILLVVQTNRYYHWRMDSLDKGSFPQPHVTEVVKFVLLAITIQIGHCPQDQLTDY